MPVLGKRRTFSSPAAYAPAGGGGGFTPDSLFPGSEKGGWWDSSDLTTLFQHSNGTTAVASNADPVGYWGDKSGNGNHFIQASESSPDRRPAYTTDFGVKSDGTSDWLQCAVASQITNTTLWWCMVLRIEAWVGAYDRFLSAFNNSVDHASVGAAVVLARDNTDNEIQAYRNNGALSTAAVSTATKYIVESKFDGTNHTLTINGTAASSVASSGSFVIDNIRIFVNNGTSYSNASCPESILVDKVPTSQEILDCREYLRTKWSVY